MAQSWPGTEPARNRNPPIPEGRRYLGTSPDVRHLAVSGERTYGFLGVEQQRAEVTRALVCVFMNLNSKTVKLEIWNG